MIQSKLAKPFSSIFKFVYNMHWTKLASFKSSPNSSKTNYNKRVNTLNWFFFRTILFFQFEKDSYQWSMHDQDNDAISKANLHEDAEVPLALPRPIIKLWEEVINKKHWTNLGYEKEVTFHILDYPKPIRFQGVGFLQYHWSSHAPLPHPHQIHRLQHCDRVGHMKEQCFELHPCEHCGKHSSFIQMFQTQDSYKSKDSPWMDHFSAMVFNNQEDISIIPQGTFPSIDAACSREIFIFSPRTWQGGNWWSATSCEIISSDPEPQPKLELATRA